MEADFIIKTISKKFPYFSENEQEVIRNLVLHSKDKTEKFYTSKTKFLEIIYNDLVSFYRWDNEEEDRKKYRRRFLCISGLFAIIPIEELRDLAAKAKLTLKKVVYETPRKPKEGIVAEWHSYDLKYLPEFEEVLSKIPFADDMTVLDYLAGSREKRLYPPTLFTVLMPDLKEEVVADEFVTATAEPLTQTQLISLTDDKGKSRDLISLGYDLVFESAFIDFYHHGIGITPLLLLRNAHVMGLFFLKSAVLTAKEKVLPEGNFPDDFPIFRFQPENNNPETVTALLDYYTHKFIPSVEQKITKWNLELSLDPDFDMVYWPSEKYS